MSSLYAKGNPIYTENVTDLSPAVGKLVTFTAGVPAVNASTTVPAIGVVLDARKRTPIVGGSTAYDNSIGILGLMPAPVRLMLSATSAALAFGDLVMQAADGTVTKNVTGSPRVVVGVCTDLNGAAPGDYFECCCYDPDYLTF